ncbi:hypothetical protein CV093_18500 [Oceanobacillus sp. 143]|nr:hypothetical protein CV093_18500 [Oceanobacillus sp. 143]
MGVAWGIDAAGKDNTVIFAMDTETREIIKSTELYSGFIEGANGVHSLSVGTNRAYYTTAGRKLTVINPETMMSKQLIGDTVNLMDLDNEGNIYYASGADLYKLPVPLKEAIVSIEGDSVLQGDETDISLEVTLANGNRADLAGAEIEWLNSNPAIATIEDGKLTGNNAGSTEIHAIVSYNGEEIATNAIMVTIEVTTSSLTDQILELEESGQIEHSLFKQLTNSLKQAEHHYRKEHTKQAIKHLQNFRKHIDKSNAPEEIKEKLINNVRVIEESFTN